MSGLSRTEKYKELRDKIHEDLDTNISSKELSRFERRLNQLDANNFAAPQDVLEKDREASHARSQVFKEDFTPTNLSRRDRKLDINTLEQSENNTPSLNNEYIDEYIREVKQYNIEQGNALSENTSVNVLRQLRDHKTQSTSAPSKPFASQYQQQAPRQQQPMSQPAPQYTQQQTYAQNTNNEFPLFNQPRRNSDMVNTEQINLFDDPFESDSKTLSKDDIMAEVQNLVNGNTGNSQSLYDPMGTETYMQHVGSENNTHQTLLNETTQMRAQMDDYEDNLSEVNGKVHHANQVLNILLIVIIVALIIIFGIVIYLIVLSRGV